MNISISPEKYGSIVSPKMLDPFTASPAIDAPVSPKQCQHWVIFAFWFFNLPIP